MSNLTVATTILEQLGGRQFIAMTGAKDLIGSDNSLSFKIGRNSSQVNCVRIELGSDDLYTVTFSQVRKAKTGYQIKEISREAGVYFSDLQSLFTEVTGMYTSLGTMGGKS